MATGDELLQAQEILQGRLYFLALKRPDALRTSHLAATSICYCTDETLLYAPFFADFGPLNLGMAYRFCKQTQELLQEAERSKKRLYYYSGPHAQAKANSAVLMGIFQVIYLNRTADEAFKPLSAFKPFVPFRDASCGVSTFHLTVLDVIKGIQKARDVGFIDWNSGSSTWSLEEYEHYEQVENGDLNWVVPNKLVAFSGPANVGNEIAGYRLHTPEDYWDYWRKKGVTAVVRLNKQVYRRNRFTDGGFRHYDLYFPDGSCPSEAILLRFLEIAESEPGAVAIHCKAGLGRTGVLICCYCMKHFRFTAEEIIGYIRVCRPGSVIGPQQNFLRDVEARMWQEGDLWRAARGINKPHLALGDLVINGRSAGASAVSSPTHQYHHSSSSNHFSSPFTANRKADVSNSDSQDSSGSTLQYTPGGVGSTGPSTPNSRVGSASAANGYASAYAAQHHANGNGTPASVVSTPVAGNGVSAARQRMDSAQSMASANGDAGGTKQYGGLAASAAHTPGAGLHVQVPRYDFNNSNSSSAASTPTGMGGGIGTLGGGYGSARTPSGTSTAAGASRIGSMYQGRSITPLRYTASASAAHGSSGFSALMASHPPAFGSGAGAGGSSIIAGVGGSGYSSRSPLSPTSAARASSGAGRAPSADRAAVHGGTAGGDRSSAGTRLRGAGAGADTGSSTGGGSPSGSPTSSTASSTGTWRIAAGTSASYNGTVPSSAGYLNGASGAGAGLVVGGASSPIPTTPKASPPGHRPGQGVARTLAPNGQPRKIPVAMLPQYHASMASRAAAAAAGMTGVGSAPLSPTSSVPTAGVAGPGSLASGAGGAALHHSSSFSSGVTPTPSAASNGHHGHYHAGGGAPLSPTSLSGAGFLGGKGSLGVDSAGGGGLLGGYAAGAGAAGGALAIAGTGKSMAALRYGLQSK